MAEQNNEQRSVLGLLLAFVAALFLVPWPGGGSSSGPTRSTVPPAPADDRVGSADALNGPRDVMSRPLVEYLGLQVDDRRSAEETTRLIRSQFVERKIAVTSMVMCVADPVASSNGYRTDLQMDTLQKALFEHRYVADRWWLPWMADDGKQKSSSGKPGVMLFRGPPDTQSHRQLLVVYLVGELMTSGIDRPALRLALEHAADIGRDSAAPRGAIPILGPVFSGSLESLALGLADSRKTRADTPLVILNFSATAFDAERFSNLAEDRSIFYAATIASFAEQRDHVLTYARSRLGLERIAWLMEAGTGLAAGTRSADQTPRGPQTDEKNTRIDRTFVFPTGIAQVRDAYAGTAATGPVTRLTSPTDRAVLRFPAEAHSTAHDLVPRFSPGMQGPYAELSLRHLLLDIARDDFQAVGITATDHRDRLFLVEQLRRHAPGVQILLVGGDLAFDHPAHRQAMLGALVVSAYPPFLAHHLWPVESGRAEKSLALPTQANSALVNAVTLGLEMVRRPPRREDGDEIHAGTNRIEIYGLASSLAESRLRHYDAPNADTLVAPTRPALWISTIGYQGAWPLRWADLPDESNVIRVRPAQTRNDAPEGPTESPQRGRASDLRMRLPGVHVGPVALTQLVVVLLVLALLADMAMRDGFEAGKSSPGQRRPEEARRDDWLPSDEWIRPFSDWWRVSEGSANDDGDRRWRLGGPLTITLLALWGATVAAAHVAWVGVMTGASQSSGAVPNGGELPFPMIWLIVGSLLLAPWGAPLFMRLVCVMIALVGCAVASNWPWFLLVAILATTAAIHLIASLARVAWQAWHRREIDLITDYWLTFCVSLAQIGLLFGVLPKNAAGDCVPWLLTSAAVFNGISPLLPLASACLAIAVVWYVELVRSWRADQYPVAPSLGVRSGGGGGDSREREAIRYPFLGRHAARWLEQQLGWTPVGGSTAVAPSPAWVVHFVLLLASAVWLADLARRLKPIYPDSATHWVCVGVLMAAFFSWVLLLIRTATLLRLLFGYLHAFRREVEKPGSRLPEAFARLHRPSDIALGRTLYYRRPPSPNLDDVVVHRATSSGYPPITMNDLSNGEQRVIGMKRFVRSLGGQILWLSAGLVVGAVLLFIASTSLPCQPRSALLLTSTLSFIAFAWVSVRTLVRIERDPILNLIAGSTPGRTTWDMQTLTRIALPVAIPLLLVLGQAFPDAWQWVGALVEGWRGS